MKKFILLLFILSFATLAAAQTKSPQPGAVAFVNVSVIPMDRERVLTNQTVIVRNGLIAVVGDAKRVRVPRNVPTIEGTGRFLIPGLMDMHVHLFSDEDEFPEELALDEFRIMLAHGVTTIRLMNGTPEQLVWREKSARGEVLAPTIYAASPQFIGKKSANAYVVTNEEEARDSVRKAKQAGYDYLKMTTDLKAEVYEAIVDEAAKLKIGIVGHADSRSVGLSRALKARQQIEHLDSYLEALLPERLLAKGSVSDIYIYKPESWLSLDHIDEYENPRTGARDY